MGTGARKSRTKGIDEPKKPEHHGELSGQRDYCTNGETIRDEILRLSSQKPISRHKRRCVASGRKNL